MKLMVWYMSDRVLTALILPMFVLVWPSNFLCSLIDTFHPNRSLDFKGSQKSYAICQSPCLLQRQALSWQELQTTPSALLTLALPILNQWHPSVTRHTSQVGFCEMPQGSVYHDITFCKISQFLNCCSPPSCVNSDWFVQWELSF